MKRRRTAGCHGNLVISHVKLQINVEISRQKQGVIRHLWYYYCNFGRAEENRSLYLDLRYIDRFKSRLSLIVRVNVVLNRTVVADSDWRFDNLCGSHRQSQSELYHVSWWHYTLVIDLIGQLRRDVIGRLSVKPWCYWLWRLVISNWCVSICLLSQ